ncbi:MAG: glycosyltransferase family 2 protein [Blastocatellia bacterium]|nr:glycosyltransferase family 2 protein [Blastocatellia bacterium]MBN8725836.1 glycosyltransferase family 2 protein [Acidobacteriota bacterium]
MSTSSKPLISIVVPVYNEESNIDLFYTTVNKELEALSDRFRFEFIFTDNHSTDNTFAKLQAIASQDSRLRVIRFSRNFGYQRSILTGYLSAGGDAAIQLDCDLQDPPNLMGVFLEKWQEGYKVVYGVRTQRKEGAVINATRKVFYRLIDLLSDTKLPYDAGDFRLIDRCIIDVLMKLNDNQPYLRGTITRIGFKQIGISYSRDERKHGESKFSFNEMLRLAIDGITSQSVIPLRFATYTGIGIFILMFFGTIFAVIAKYTSGSEWPAGFATIIVLILFSIGLNALFLGVIGEYLGRIYKQVKPEPITIVEKKLGINKEDS